MAGILIPLITEFKDTGIKQALREFRKLETTAEKAQFAIKKAAVPAAAALGAVVAVIGASVKAAIEDEAAQANLARQLKVSTGATDKQVASVEKYIASLGRSVAINDSEARPALQALVTATKDVTEAQDLLSVAVDVSAATGSNLQSVTEALAMAYVGNTRGLKALSPEVMKLIKDGGTFADVLTVLKSNFGGAGEAAANTAAGGLKKLSIAFAETQESIGAAFLPVLEALLPYLQAFASWAEKNPGVFLAIIAIIGALALAILAVNVQLAIQAALAAANPFTYIVLGIVAAIAVFVILYKKVEFFQKVVKTVVKAVVKYFETVINIWIKVINALIRGYNLIPFLDNLKELKAVDFSKTTDSADGLRKVLGVSTARARELSNQYKELRGEALDPLTKSLEKAKIATLDVDTAWKILTDSLSRTVALDDAQTKIKELEVAAAKAFKTGSASDIVKFNKAAADVATALATIASGFGDINSKEILLRFKTSGAQSALDLAAWIAGGGELKGLGSFDLLTQAGIPGKASGGPVMGGSSYIVGERGPELFTPKGSGTITPNGALGGNTITINVQGADPNAVVRALQDYNRTAGPIPVNTRAN
jgi:hypothetical protein